MIEGLVTRMITVSFSGFSPPVEDVLKLIGYIALARFRILLAIGRIGYRLAKRYGQVGLGGLIGACEYEINLREKYGLPPIKPLPPFPDDDPQNIAARAR